MKIALGTILWVLQGVVGVFSIFLTLFPLFRALSNREYDFLDLNWVWWAIIGFIIFFLVVMSVIVRLILTVRCLHSDEANLDRKKKQLEIEKLEAEKMSRENPTLI